MAGIYLHIPFCKQACSYCDFHFSTSLKNKTELLKAMEKEIVFWKKELDNDLVDTIYFGGGTPSLLEEAELKSLLEKIYKNYKVSENVEVTLEANPDDLSADRLRMLGTTPVNRLSIGVQSFYDEDLRFMKRAHDSEQAYKSVLMSQDAGFKNITIDLIYGVPTLTPEKWQHNLQKTRSLSVPHLSAYCLTVEPHTALDHDIRKGRISEPDEDQAVEHFRMLTDWAAENNYIHYEISNFGKEGCFSRHNTSYWRQEKYLGIGPAAHAFNGTNRRWNVRNNVRYIRAWETDQPSFEEETLTPDDRYNEYVMTSLRTMWGISAESIEKQFGRFYRETIEMGVEIWLKSGEIILTGDRYTLSEKGKLVADKIAAHLFVTE